MGCFYSHSLGFPAACCSKRPIVWTTGSILGVFLLQVSHLFGPPGAEALEIGKNLYIFAAGYKPCSGWVFGLCKVPASEALAQEVFPARFQGQE